MSVFKFLSFASLSLLFLGNIKADCIDLTGIYACKTGELKLSQNTNQQGIKQYIVTHTSDEGTVKTATYPITSYPTAPGAMMIITCNEDQVVVEIPFVNASHTYSLNDYGNLVINIKAEGPYTYDKERLEINWKADSQTPVRTIDETEYCSRI